MRSKAEKLLADLLAGSVEGVVAVVNALTVTQPDVDAAGARSPGRDIIDIPPDSKLHLRRQPAPH